MPTRLRTQPAHSPEGRAAVSACGDLAAGFYDSSSAADLADRQGVRPIRRLGQLRSFADPDPKEAEWFARQIRKWRTEPKTRG